jgi:hypothetical protein
LLLPASIAKNVGHNKLGESCLSKNTEEPHVNVVRSVWRRLKKDLKEAIIRDLQPRKDVKGGGGVKKESKATTEDTRSRRGY